MTAPFTLLLGDALEMTRTLGTGSVHTCVTSPAFFQQRDYGVPGQLGLERDVGEFTANLTRYFREVWRVLRKDGTLWINLGETYNIYAGNRSRASEYARGRARKEPRLPSGYGLIEPSLKNKDMIGVPWRMALALQGMAVVPAASVAQWADLLAQAREHGDWELVRVVTERLRLATYADVLKDSGWTLRQDIIWAKPNALPESLRDRCTKAHEHVFMLSKGRRYYYDARAISEPASAADRERQQAARAVFKAKGLGDEHLAAMRAVAANDDQVGERVRQLAREARQALGDDYQALLSGERKNRRDVWSIPTKRYSGTHTAAFPVALAELCVLAGAPPGGAVLDNFCGSGSTGVVALRHGRSFIGIDLSARALEEARVRLTATEERLFTGVGEDEEP